MQISDSIIAGHLLHTMMFLLIVCSESKTLYSNSIDVSTYCVDVLLWTKFVDTLYGLYFVGRYMYFLVICDGLLKVIVPKFMARMFAE